MCHRSPQSGGLISEPRGSGQCFLRTFLLILLGRYSHMEMSQTHTAGVWCVFTQSPPLPSVHTTVYRFLEPFLTFKGERRVQRPGKRGCGVSCEEDCWWHEDLPSHTSHVSLHILFLFQQVSSLNKGILDHIHVNTEVRK